MLWPGRDGERQQEQDRVAPKTKKERPVREPCA